jgi:chromosome segregation ATPase
MADINNFIDKNLVNSLVQINEQLVLAGQNIDKTLLPAIQKLEKAQQQLGKKTNENSNERKKLTANEKEAAKIQKQLETTEAKLISLQKGQQDALIKTKTELQKNTKAVKDLQRVQAAQRGSTEQLAAVNVILEKRLRNVNQTTLDGKKKADLLRSAIDKNNKKITQQSSEFVKTKRNIGNYSSALDGLSPGFARASAGANKLSVAFKLLLANPVILVISAIVAAFAGLVAIFKSTDDGGTKLQGVFDGIKNVLGVLKNALAQVIDAFTLIREGKFREAFRAIGDAAKFAADNVTEAYKAGALYANQLDELNDRIISNISAQAETLRQFREYLNLSKDQTKTDKERLEFLNKAQQAATEYYGQLAEDERKRFDLDVANVASRTKLTADELASFIALDGKRAEEVRKNNSKIAEAWNALGDDTIKSLEEQYAKATEADTQYFKRTSEITSLRSGLLKKITEQEAAEAKEREFQNELRSIQIEELTAKEIDSTKSKNDAEVELEIEKLNAKQVANENYTQSLIDDEFRLAEAKREAADIGLEVAVASFSAIANLAKEDSKLKKAAIIAATVAEKAQAVFRIKTATNVAATQALALPLPPPFPQILSGIYKALGFAQAAAVISRPIPQFAKGTNYSPAGVAELAERGRELVQNPDGTVWMAENRGLYNLQQGSKVLTNQKTEAILNDNRMVNELKLTRKAIQRQKATKKESAFDARQAGYRAGFQARKYRLN